MNLVINFFIISKSIKNFLKFNLFIFFFCYAKICEKHVIIDVKNLKGVFQTTKLFSFRKPSTV